MGIKQLTLINGNGQSYKMNIPKLVYLTDSINDVALNHIKENTGLKFDKVGNTSYMAQPTNFKQITALFMTYDFKTEYHDNASTHNTIYLKGLHNVGFKVESICFECCKKNNVYCDDMDKNSMLMC